MLNVTPAEDADATCCLGMMHKEVSEEVAEWPAWVVGLRRWIKEADDALRVCWSWQTGESEERRTCSGGTPSKNFSRSDTGATEGWALSVRARKKGVGFAWTEAWIAES